MPLKGILFKNDNIIYAVKGGIGFTDHAERIPGTEFYEIGAFQAGIFIREETQPLGGINQDGAINVLFAKIDECLH